MEIPKKFIYLICPVNDVAPKEKEFLDNYVSDMESKGNRVHYPPRDVNQIDPIGIRILTEHRAAMREVNEVQAYFGQKTKGSYFDFGMTFMADLPLYIINSMFIERKKLEDFDKFALGRSVNMKPPATEGTHNLRYWAENRREEIENSQQIEYAVKDLDKQFFFDFGMAFYTGKPIILANREDVEKLAVRGKKSFQNVLLELDSLYRQ